MPTNYGKNPGAEDEDSGMEIDTPSAETESKTALLPLDFFEGPVEPGKTCKVRVERVLEGQAEVSYVPGGSEEPEMGMEPEESDAEMAEYMET